MILKWHLLNCYIEKEGLHHDSIGGSQHTGVDHG